MSFNGFKALLDTHSSNRTNKIAMLASDTDILSGIINDETDCDADYWQNEGPTSETGTAYGAIVDILDALQGRDSEAIINIDSKFRVNTNGVAIGDEAYPNDLYALLVVGDTLQTGDLTVAGTLTAAGAVSYLDDVSIATGKDLVIADGTINIIEQLMAGEIGNERELTFVDSLGNFNIKLPVGGFGAYEPWGRCFGFMVTTDETPTNKILMYLDQNNGHLTISEPYGGLVEQNTYRSQAGLTLAAATSSPVLRLLSGGAASSSQIIFEGGWVPGPNSNTGTRTASLLHVSDAVSNFLQMRIGSNTMSRFYPDAVDFFGQSPDFAMTLSVRAQSSDDNYFMQVTPGVEAPSERTVTGTAYAPALIIGSGRGLDKTGRLGFESWHEYSGLRLWIENQTDPGIVPFVSFGKPLGSAASPLDNLAVMDDPWMVVINDNPRDIAANHATKEGLWIGAGNGSSIHGGARIWMRDASNRRATVKWGTTEEVAWSFVKNGVMHMAVGMTSENYAGSNTDSDANLGAPRIGYHVTQEAWTSMADIYNELAFNFDMGLAGAAVLVYTQDDSTCRLCVIDTQGDMQVFTPSSTYTVP